MVHRSAQASNDRVKALISWRSLGESNPCFSLERAKVRIERSGADLWPHAAETQISALGKICGPHAPRAWVPPEGPPMRRTALALFVVEPTQLRWGKLDLIRPSQNSDWGVV